jgi:hypothetical protein
MDRNQPKLPLSPPIASEFGDLRLGQETIPYHLYEMATHNLGIVTTFPLKVGDKLELELQNQTIPLIVHQLAGHQESQVSAKRFRLVSFEKSVNFERFFSEQRLRSYAASSRIRLRHSRFPTEEAAPLVLAKTFGAHLFYKLRTLNASRSGMLLETCQGSEAPFAQGTLLELKIQRTQEEVISCLAKVVRCELNPMHAGRLYGIALTEIPNEHKESFQTFIESLEEKSNESLRLQLSA